MDVPRKASKDDREILVVEDSPTQAERLKYILEQHGYKISVARNGREALAKISQRLPLVVISDIMMPEMDGYQLCRQIKGDDKLKEVPVILLTSLADPVDSRQGIRVRGRQLHNKTLSGNVSSVPYSIHPDQS